MMHKLVPDFILKKFTTGKVSGSFSATALFVDVSGFTAITDALMQHGQHGAEILATIMRAIFDPLFNSMHTRGGFVANMAGDAFITLFPEPEVGSQTVAVKRGLAAAWALQQQMIDLAVQSTPYGGFRLIAKVGLAKGTVNWGIVTSDNKERAAFYFKGPAIDNCIEAEKHARGGDIILSAEFHEKVVQLVTSKPVADYYRVVAVTDDLPGPHPFDQPPGDIEAVTRFFPRDLITQSHSGEFRQVVNVFINLPTVRTEHQLTIFMQTIFTLQDHYGGLLNRLDFGDKGIHLVLFWGTPVAYENDIERALNMILDLQTKTAIPIKAGVTYRIAHCGFIGSAHREEYTCYGRGVNLAARLMTRAPRGEIWVGENVAHNVKLQFDFELYGEIKVKGFSEKQVVFTLFERKEALETFYHGDLIGREFELKQLVNFIQPIFLGKYAGVLVVRGEPGIGKSRLVHELQISRLFHPFDILWALCQTNEILRESLNPFRYWLKNYFEISDIQVESRNKRNFNRKLDDLISNTEDQTLVDKLDHTRSCLGALVGLHWPDSLYEQLDAQGRYEKTFSALATLLQSESLRQPVVLIIEDIQWLDDDSKKFLLYLDRMLSAGNHRLYPIAILATAREEAVSLSLGDPIFDQEVILGAFSREELAGLVKAHLGSSAASSLLDQLEEQAEGNPYFAEQMLHFLKEEGLLIHSENGWRITGISGQSPLSMNVRSLLVARLDRLTYEVKEAVQTASILGREFDVRLLAYMLRLTDIAALVIKAEQQGIWSALRKYRYIFKHALLRNAAYQMQVQTRRQELHGLAVDGLESLFQDELSSHFGALAHHAEQAQLVDKALHYLQLAGETAARRYANIEAIEYFHRALALLLTLPDTPERSQIELALHMSLGPLLMAARGYGAAEVESTYARAQQLAVQTGQIDLLFRATWGQWQHYNQVADFEMAQVLVTHLFRLAEQSRDESFLIEAYHSGWGTEFALGNLHIVEAHTDRGRDVYDWELHREHILVFGHDPGVCAHMIGGLNLWLLGYPDQARHRMLNGLALAQDIGHPYTTAMITWGFVVLSNLLGEKQNSFERAEELLIISQEHGFTLLANAAKSLQAISRVSEGRTQEGVAQIREIVNQALSVGQFMLRKWILSEFLEACLFTDAVDEGLQAIEFELAYPNTSSLRLFESEIQRLYGEFLLVKRGYLTREVEDKFQLAYNIARGQRAKSLELRASMSLARFWYKRGKRSQARQILRESYNWFTEGFDTTDLIQAKTLFGELQ